MRIKNLGLIFVFATFLLPNNSAVIWLCQQSCLLDGTSLDPEVTTASGDLVLHASEVYSLNFRK